MKVEQILSQFQATGVETCFHDRHIVAQIYAGLDGRNWRLRDYESRGGYQALRKILGLDGGPGMTPDQVVAEVKASGLRGRGGAGFPTGLKWSFMPKNYNGPKYLVCNSDEGEPGTFKDRWCLERDPHRFLEGLLIAAWAVGIEGVWIYLRDEYHGCRAILERELARLQADPPCALPVIELRRGAGAYICGEESAMIESIEGKRGIVRAKPPLPALQGLFGQPTVINNVITLASVPIIMAKGAAFYKDFGMGRSTGTLPFQITGNIKQGGLVERAFGSVSYTHLTLPTTPYV